VLICISAFFSIAEMAFASVNKVRLKSLSEDGRKAAKTALKILEDFRKMLSAILIGSNVVNLSASAIMATWANEKWGNGSPAVGIATGILTLAVILWSDLIPKTLANIYAERIVLAIAGIVLLVMSVLTPVIFLVDIIARATLKVLRINPEHKETMTETELKTYVDTSHKDGVIETDERKMIYNVFEFSDTKARDVMLPRVKMVAIHAEAGYGEALALFEEYMHTRYPVYREDKDIIVGLMNIKDMILVEDRENFRVEQIMRDGFFIPEIKKTADLLLEMQKNAINMAFVTDEYGLTVGMITLEDLLEEIVGEIRDEYDEDEMENIQQIDEHTYLVEGGMKIDDINEALGCNLDSEDYDSIGGIMIESLIRLPEDGETVVTADGISLQAQGISQNRIEKVVVVLPQEDEAEEEGEEAEAPEEAKEGDVHIVP
jgi:CBS domain containing-hemolysin-like protein